MQTTHMLLLKIKREREKLRFMFHATQSLGDVRNRRLSVLWKDEREVGKRVAGGKREVGRKREREVGKKSEVGRAEGGGHVVTVG